MAVSSLTSSGVSEKSKRQIFLLMREKRRLRDRGDAALNAPPQSDLGRRLAVGGSDLF